MPFKKDPRIPPRTPKQLAEEKAIHEQLSRERPRPDPTTAIRAKDFREYLRLVAAFKKARDTQGMTLAQLAEKTGMDEPNLSRLLAAKTANPTLSTLFRVAAALGMDLTFGLTPSENKPAASPDEKQAPTGS